VRGSQRGAALRETQREWQLGAGSSRGWLGFGWGRIGGCVGGLGRWVPGPAVGCLAGGAKKRDFWQETSAENTGTDQTVSKTALLISIQYSTDFPRFYPVSFFFPRTRDLDGFCGIQCRLVWDFSFPFQAAAVTAIATTALLLS